MSALTEETNPNSVRFKRGDINEKTGLIFWGYHSGGCGVWDTKGGIDRRRKISLRSTRRWQSKNMDHVLQINRIWHAKNRNRVTERKREHRKMFPERYKKYDRERSRIRRRAPIYRFNLGLYNSVNNSFFSRGHRRKCKTVEILGCSFGELKSHIESLFEQGMTWSNRGVHRCDGRIAWHVDHIVPLDSANNEKELLLLWNYKNLRPMWAKNNLQKGAMTKEQYEERSSVAA